MILSRFSTRAVALTSVGGIVATLLVGDGVGPGSRRRHGWKRRCVPSVAVATGAWFTTTEGGDS